MPQSSMIPALQIRTPEPERHSGRGIAPAQSGSLQAAATPYGEHRRTQGVINDQCRILTSESWEAYGRNDFSEPRLLHLPMHRILNLGYLLLLLATQICLTLCNPWTIACQTPRSMGFSREEYWTGLPFPSPGDLPDAGTEPRSPTLQAGSLLSEPLSFL